MCVCVCVCEILLWKPEFRLLSPYFTSTYICEVIVASKVYYGTLATYFVLG